jgi:alkylation response protein AidB-like acyl-CoA dehydrogenase
MSDTLKGGEFLIKESTSTLIPEEFNEEQKMIAQMCDDFVAQEVAPNLDRIDDMEEGLMESILDKAGELGLLSMSIPEELGGMGSSFVTSMIATEYTGHAHSAAVAMSAHSGIGTLPILYFGNEEQKNKYIPKLATGELKAAYCLTEPGAGSDANSGKTKAVLSENGKNYIINGQKMWITNSGFADIFVVFAKIDDDENLSAFIVDTTTAQSEFITFGEEEKKMGIKGSSTRQVFFNGCPVPVENLLGERGQGFKIALNILNIGRLKLAGATLGASKKTIDQSVQYANEREQFGRPISKYGASKNKIGEQIIRTFATESALYRVCNNIDELIAELVESGNTKEEATLKAIHEYAAEAAILKIHGSETLDYVVDEGVQIYGGMGYSAESPVERSYRDSRINRIFEGTNEINRQLAVDFILKKAMKGKLDLMGPAQKVAGELMSIPDMSAPEGEYGVEGKYIANFKKAILMTAGAAVQKLMMSLAKEQEVLMGIADMMIEVYVAESMLLRVKKIDGDKSLEETIMRAYIYDAADRINKSGKDVLNSFAEGDELRMMLIGLKRFTKHDHLNIKEAKRMIADSKIKA